MKLGDWFQVDEFGKGLTEQHVQNYYMLVRFALDPIREKFGQVIITSGFRSPEFNATLSAAAQNSQHCLGEAADFFCPYANEGMGVVYRWVLDELKWPGETFYYKRRGHCHIALPRYNIKIDQLVFEDK